MKLTRGAATWAKVRGLAGRNAPETATHYLVDEARRDADPLHGALHDPVTGLPERALLLDRIALAMARARRKDEEVALLLLAVEDVEALRVRLGGSQGDRVLRDVAERIARGVRDTDTVARFGPADFAVLCEGIADRDTLMLVAGRIASNLAAPYAVRFGSLDLDIGMELLMVGGETPPLAFLDMADDAVAETRRRTAD
ncbi:MAG TPA: GGDEF domain-containing protein [Frankiaceae bacterium]|nr:GGDEF domain-containing protein [Frankiaceae bacterium]